MIQATFPFNDDDGNDESDVYHPARHDDPETSQKAAQRVASNLDRFRATSRKGKLLVLYGGGTFTDEEAARLLSDGAQHCQIEGWRKRCSELRIVEFITDTEVRRCNPGSPDESMVCTITEKGRAALRHLDETGWSK